MDALEAFAVRNESSQYSGGKGNEDVISVAYASHACIHLSTSSPIIARYLRSEIKKTKTSDCSVVIAGWLLRVLSFELLR